MGCGGAAGPRRGYFAETGRGAAAVATWIYQRRRVARGRDVDIARRRVAATPRGRDVDLSEETGRARTRARYSAETGRGGAAA